MRVLVRHFFGGLLRPETAAGEDSFVEWLAQVLGVLIAASWFFPAYGLMGRYARLHSLSDPEPYRRSLESHFLMVLCVVMLLTAVLTAIEWPMLFPGRRDHLVLSPLPVRRRQIFAAKLAAVMLFVSIFIAATAGVLGATLAAVAHGTHEARGWLMSVGAHLAGALAAGYFVFFALFAAQGVLAAIVPARWLGPVSFFAQSVLLLAAVGAFPLLPYFPAGDYAQAAWLPPAWFAGWTAWLKGDPAPLAARGVSALVTAVVLTLVGYGVAYRRFAAQALEVSRTRRGPWLAGTGMGAFLLKTLARSRDQKLVWMMIGGLGVALLAENSLYLSRRMTRYGWEAIAANARGSVIAVPLMLSYFALAGLRRAFRLPVDPPANWVFRFAEDAVRRRRWLDSAWNVFVGLGGYLPLALCLPAHFVLLPPATAGLVLVWQVLLVATLANVLMLGWNAVPFTALHHAARRHFLHSAVAHLAMFVPFVFGGALAIEEGLRDGGTGAAGTAALAAGWWALRRARLRAWGVEPLEFVEETPDLTVIPLH